VPDVELLDLRDGGDRGDVPVGQSVARVDEESHIGRVARRPAQLVERPVVLAPAVRVAARVQLDRRHAEVLGCVQGGKLRVDEEADPDPRLVQPANRVAQPRTGAAQIETALGGDFLSPLGHQGRLIRPEPAGQLDDLRAGGELQVEHPDGRGQALDVVILDVAPVLAQVDRNAVRARRFAQRGRLERIGLVGPSRLTHRGHVVDIDVEPDRHHCPGSESGLTSHANICQVSTL
jgi:hypothetical protein